ncbi:DUF1579 family protein [Longimicrobium sp.]|uniref:DUF1579 family protein n=1 Tax=Longimicrobium sp. TaxID=2029185 RepID=UPI003B3AF8C3
MESDLNAAQPPRPGPEHAALAPFIGRWRTSGQVLASGSAPALEIAGVDEYEWLPGGFFLLHRVDVRIGGEPARALEIIGWDAGRGTYFMRSFDDQGNAGEMQARVHADGTWRFAGDTERFTGVFSDGGDTLTGRWERREGDEWLPWMDVHLTKGDG